MDPLKRLTLSGFRSSNDFPWSKYRQNDNGIEVQLAVTIKAAVVAGSRIIKFFPFCLKVAIQLANNRELSTGGPALADLRGRVARAGKLVGLGLWRA